MESPADFELVEELTPAPSRRADELIGLQDVLEQMPESQRRAILLREWQGLSYREIAEELELSQAAVETLIFRARRSLAQGLETPPEPARARVRRGADLGNVLAGLKTLLFGGGAAATKVAATVAIVSASTVAVASPVRAAREPSAAAGRARHGPGARAAAATPAAASRAVRRPHLGRPPGPPSVRRAASRPARRAQARSGPSWGRAGSARPVRASR